MRFYGLHLDFEQNTRTLSSTINLILNNDCLTANANSLLCRLDNESGKPTSGHYINSFVIAGDTTEHGITREVLD